MKLRSQVLLGASLLVSFVLGWALGSGRDAPARVATLQAEFRHGSDRESSDSIVLVPEVMSQPEREAVKCTSGLDHEPTKPIPRAPTVHEAFVALADAIRSEPIYDGQDDSFAAKYRDATSDQLQAALVIVRRQQEQERASIVKERMTRGLYTESVVAAGEETPSARTSPGSGPVSFGFETEQGNGYTKTKTTIINGDEYPEYRSVELELWWLMRQLRSRGLSDCSK